MEQDRSSGAQRGLGPRGTSLKAKLGQASGLTFSDPFAMQLEQQERKEQRVAATMRWANRNRTPPKPEAPVLPLGKLKGRDRGWLWNGDSIGSKGLYNGHEYVASDIRKAGFKLPKLAQTKAQRKPKAEGKNARNI